MRKEELKVGLNKVELVTGFLFFSLTYIILTLNLTAIVCHAQLSLNLKGILMIWFLAGFLSLSAAMLFLYKRKYKRAVTAICICAGLIISQKIPMYACAAISSNQHNVYATPDPDINHVIIETQDKNDIYDVFINGVKLGKTPLKIKLTDLAEKIPQNYPKQPVELEEPVKITRSDLSTQGYDYTRPVLKLRNYSHKYSLGQRYSLKPFPEPLLIEIKYNNQPVYLSTMLSYGHSVNRTTITFYPYLPEVEEELKKLLKQARLNDYKVESEWFKRFQKLGKSKREHLQKLAAFEPGLKLLSASLQEKINLADITDTETTSWETFQNICEKIKTGNGKINSYDKYSPTINRIAPQLPEKELVEFALKMLKRNNFDFYHWNRPYWLYLSGAVGNVSRKEEEIFSLTFDALRLKDEELDKAEGENYIESHFVPELIRDHYDSDDFMKFALKLGGRELDELVEKQCAIAAPKSWPERKRESIYSQHNGINRWLNYMCLLKSPKGDMLRKKYSSDLHQIADKYLQNLTPQKKNSLNMVYPLLCSADEEWETSVARQVYESYKQQNPEINSLTLITTFTFLKASKATPPVSVYTSDITEQAIFYLKKDNYSVFDTINNQINDLPDENKIQIYNSLLQACSTFDMPDEKSKQSLERLKFNLKHELFFNMGQSVDLTSLFQNTTPYAEWFIQNNPNHPAIKEMLYSDKSYHRDCALKVLQECPTPQNRALLNEYQTQEEK